MPHNFSLFGADQCSLWEDAGMDQSDSGPLLTAKYANSAFWGAKSATRPPLFINSDTQPLFLQILHRSL